MSRPLPGFPADPEALLDWLRPRVPAATVQRIAAADYGHRATENAAVLQAIVEGHNHQRRLSGPLREVLQLTRWATDPDPVAPALACTLLAREQIEDGDHLDDGLDTFTVLLASCRALGPPALAGLEGLLAAIVQAHPLDAETGHDFMGAQAVLLLTAALRTPGDPRVPAHLRRMEDNHRLGRGEEPTPGWLGALCLDGLRAAVLRDIAREAVAAHPGHGPLATALGLDG